jgi:hypothetical protein
MSEDVEGPTAFLHPAEIRDLFYAGPAIRVWIVGCEDRESQSQPVEVPVERCVLRAHSKSAAQAKPGTHVRIARRPR